MKLRDLLGTAAASLWRNKSRTILTVLATLIGAFTIALTLGIRVGVNSYISRQVDNVGEKDQLMVYANTPSGSASDKPEKYDPAVSSTASTQMLTTKQVQTIAKVKGVAKVTPMKNFTAEYIQGASKQKYAITATDGQGTHVDMAQGLQASGRAYTVDLNKAYVKALGYSNPKAALGHTVQIAATNQTTNRRQVLRAKIVGVRNASIVDGGQVVFSPGLIDAINRVNNTGLPSSVKNQYYTVLATVSHPTKKNLSRIQSALTKKGMASSTFADEVGSIHQTINAVTGGLTLFGAIALLAAAFGIINTLYMSVRDRTREIGLMKALGLSRGKIFASFSLEAALIGLLGAGCGCGLALLASNFVNKAATSSFLKGMSGFTLIQFSAGNTLTILALITVIAVLAGTLPAIRAARLVPISALRYE
ncbi:MULTISPECIES: ABC transporter permease [unclassified Lacticaseibacillus]|uniref:ABC transporter permease n=1 Tax=unclassified Lacticaseibacillus TaxID=2759744 RepID=UPI0019436AA7|nr:MULTISPECIES: ABC transporter permease [unclassified Lacticaseibacillus]